MNAKILLELTPLEFACIRISLSQSAAPIYHEFNDKDCSKMNEYQDCVCRLSEKFNQFNSQ